MSAWRYDEFRHCGVDYSMADQAKVYDERHGKFRDFKKEFDGMMASLELRDPGQRTVIDLGCGTGTFSVLAAEAFKAVYAVDVSEAMLEQAKIKADGRFTNLFFVHGGFLTYAHAADPVDLVITKAALHHLPDFWKQVALQRINRMLKPGGLLYLHDVVFQFEPGEYAARIDAWIEKLAEVAGDKLRRDVEAHIRNEYSTFDWILRGLLERAGFVVEKGRSDDGFMSEYVCRKARGLGGGTACE